MIVQKKRLSHMFSLILVLAALGGVVSCASGTRLRTGGVDPAAVTGTYTLILFGAQHSDDLETLAILDREGDRTVIEPYAPAYRYSVKKGLPAKEALGAAEHFLSWHRAYQTSQVLRIVDERGETIGYEMRPLYQPFVYGVNDVLEVDYWKQEDKVTARIRLRPSIESLFEGRRGGRNGGNGSNGLMMK